MNKILILHPEGNLNGNPNLYGITKILGENGWNVEVISRRVSGCYQGIDLKNVTFTLLKSFNKKNIDSHIMTKRLLFPSIKEKPALIIGVDEGIIEAAYYANKYSIPLGLISYEIKYDSEIGKKYISNLGKEFKKEEIRASDNLDFIVIQDKTRERELIRENKIKKVRSFLIPVAGARTFICQKSRYIHEKYNISDHKKIVLSIGSVCDWSCSGELIESVNNWPDDWILFLHSRGDDGKVYINKHVSIKGRLNDKIIVSDESIENIEDMGRIVLSSDIGVVFYKATYFDYSCGDNIKYVGMSSGKASTYLKFGIPLAVFGNSYYEEYVEVYNIGVKVTDPTKFIPIRFDDEIASRCTNFFDCHLDLGVTATEFIKYLERFRDNT
jgi:hypothetical protein